MRTDGVESLWSMLKRPHKGTFHKLPPKHLDGYVREVAGRHNLREIETIEIMNSVISGMNRKRFKYEDLIADYGLQNGSRG